MKILLTGANGFTGKNFSTAAKMAGHEIIALRSNLMDKQNLLTEIREIHPEAVVHLAAISFVANTKIEDFYNINIIGTTNLLEALVEKKNCLKTVLLASSANIYGNCNDSPIREEQTPAPNNHYAISKFGMECIAKTFADDLPIVFARPFNYTGPGQAPHFLIPKLVEHFALKKESIELGNLNIEREFNDVNLISESYLALLRHRKIGEIYNICTGKAYTLKQVTDLLEKISCHHIQIVVKNELIRKNEVLHLYGDPSKLKELFRVSKINFPTISLSETLSTMLKQYN